MSLPVRSFCPETLSTGNFRKGLILAGIPDPDTPSGHEVHIGNIPNVKAIAGGADVGAVGAGEAPTTNLLPHSRLKTLPEHPGKKSAVHRDLGAENLGLPGPERLELGKMLRLCSLEKRNIPHEVLTFLGAHLDEKILSKIREEEVISSLGKERPHEPTGGIGIAVVVALESDDGDVLSADEIVQVLGPVAEDHIKTLNACEIAGVYPKEDEGLNLYHWLEFLSSAGVVLRKSLILGHEVLLWGENGRNVPEGDVAASLNLGEHELPITLCDRRNHLSAADQGLHKKVERTPGKDEVLHTLPPFLLFGE